MLASLFALSVLLADPVQIDCPMAGLSGAQRADIRALFAEGGGPTDPRFAPLRQAGDQCGARFGWNERVRALAIMYAGSLLGEASMRDVLTAANVDVDAIERLVLARAAWRGFATGSQEQLGAMQRFAEQNITALQGAAGSHREDTRIMTFVGAFIAARALIESARTEFAAE